VSAWLLFVWVMLPVLAGWRCVFCSWLEFKMLATCLGGEGLFCR